MEVDIIFKDGSEDLLTISASHTLEMILNGRIIVNGNITLYYNFVRNTWVECVIKLREEEE